jgi:hypothetical protein
MSVAHILATPMASAFTLAGVILPRIEAGTLGLAMAQPDAPQPAGDRGGAVPTCLPLRDTTRRRGHDGLDKSVPPEPPSGSENHRAGTPWQ